MYMIMRYFNYCFSSVVVLVNKKVETKPLWFHALTIPLRVSDKTNTKDRTIFIYVFNKNVLCFHNKTRSVRADI